VSPPPTASAGFDETYFEHLPGLEERSFWFRSRNALIIWALRRYFPQARSMLEVGCGTGFVLRGVRDAFPQMRLVGGEPFEAGLAVAAERVPDAELMQLDARDLPFRGEFDVVGAFDVLEHIDDDEQALSAMYEALRPGGGLLATVPQHPRLWSAADDYSHHIRRYRRGELPSKLRDRGFDVLRQTSFVSLLLPVLALSRLRFRDEKDFDPLSEFRAPPFVDSALRWVLTAERTLIRRGLSFPAGGSLLVVARRP
jgi:SAM-dependent methyltransferase